ncbi:MAG: hypothetical protein HYT16_00440 [DPANN group archaeon]|nr:hypothetical protein [DPANN group archaeon]
MATHRKKAYMKSYNQLATVKQRKAEYMRKVRAEADQDASRKLVQTLLDLGFEGLATEYAQERAPEMLVTVSSKSRQRKR